ncbi:MAG: hypothetical protein ACP59X_12895 [Solidesulfovibrio sp. DCME]|uniref:hypothetical protein n=1 Tax=Solidesulfovibrio sp. DCME TaxID=3447380 RepID=UPI003D11B86E
MRGRASQREINNDQIEACRLPGLWYRPSMGKLLVHVQVGIALEQLVSDALDALLFDGHYPEAIELNSCVFDAPSPDATLQCVLQFVDLSID